MQENGIYLNLWCFKDLVGKAVLFQISPIRLICVVMQADVSNIVKVECLGCQSRIVMILLAKWLYTEMLLLLIAHH